MATDVLGFAYSAAAANLYALIRNRDGEIWDAAVDSAFETYATANLGDYDVALTEQGTASRYYTFTFPSSISAGRYYVTVYLRAGGSPAEGDTAVAEGTIDWDGSAIIDLDHIPVDVQQVDGDATAATNLKQTSLAVQVGAVATAAGDANSATAFDTNLTQENDDYYGDSSAGIVLAFVSGTDNQFQNRRVIASTDSGGNTRITMEAAFDATPSDSDTFVILGRRG